MHPIDGSSNRWQQLSQAIWHPTLSIPWRMHQPHISNIAQAAELPILLNLTTISPKSSHNSNYYQKEMKNRNLTCCLLYLLIQPCIRTAVLLLQLQNGFIFFFPSYLPADTTTYNANRICSGRSFKCIQFSLVV